MGILSHQKGPDFAQNGFWSGIKPHSRKSDEVAPHCGDPGVQYEIPAVQNSEEQTGKPEQEA
jgi:hypothetical protein